MISHFHTPELPAPLNLDLASLAGGGAAPSQFYGKTQDGQDVYVRYRGGWISLRIGKRAGEDALATPPLIDAKVGPDFDGCLSLHQFCRHFGVRVNGALPAETDKAALRYTDLSGQTTYWRSDLPQVTHQTSRALLAACQRALPDALMVQPVLDEKFRVLRLQAVTPAQVQAATIWLVQGAKRPEDIPTDPSEYVLPQRGQIQINIHYRGWQWPGLRQHQGIHAQACKDLGRALLVPSALDATGNTALPLESFHLKADFETKDTGTRQMLLTLAKALAGCMPVTTLEHVDLRTGAVVETLQQPLDPLVARWVQAQTDRWIYVRGDTREGPWIGLRPATV